MAPSLDTLLTKLNRHPTSPLSFLAFDPGETTGWAAICWDHPFDPTRTACGQVKTESVAQGTLQYDQLIHEYQPDFMVIEEYRVYSWKSDQHKWSDVITLRLIGALEALSYLRAVPFYKQMAAQAKDFCTDEKLTDWNLFVKGQRHARDALRHATSFMLFNKEAPIKRPKKDS